MVAVAAAGFAAGGINAVVGSGTLVTFPVLLAVGLPPVTATVSNSLGLVAGQPDRRDRLPPGTPRPAAAAAPPPPRLRARRTHRRLPAPPPPGGELRGDRPGPRRARRRARRRPAAGAARPGPPAPADDDQSSTSGPGRMAALFAGAYVTGTYGGYFAASQGVLQIGIFGLLLRESLQRLNAIKNVLTTRGERGRRRRLRRRRHRPRRLAAAGLLAVGSILGGYLGARFGRRLPSAVLRTAIVVLGLVAIVVLLTPMSPLEFGFLVLAGIGAGLTGSIAGLASLISYPALLAIGLPPVTANVTNTVALVLNSVGSVSASRPELRGQARRLLPLAVAAVLGGTAGAVAPAAHPVRGVRAGRPAPDRRGLGGDPRAAAAPRARRRGRRPPPGPPRPALAPAGHVRHRHLRRLLRRRRRGAPAGDVPAGHRRDPPPRQRHEERRPRGRERRRGRRLHRVRLDRLVGGAAAGDRALRRRPARPAGGAPGPADGAAPGDRRRRTRPGDPRWAIQAYT